MGVVPSTTHRLTAPDRRRQLIEAAMDLFSRKGFAGTTTKEIALAAGVSEAIIFRHFATKDDLYWEVLSAKSAPDELKKQLETKLFGFMRAIRLVYPMMKAQK